MSGTETLHHQAAGGCASPHGAGPLLLTGRLHFAVEVVGGVKGRLFPEILQERTRN